MAVKKGGLGRGFGSVLDENTIDNGGLVEVELNEIEPNREQPRKDFDQAALNELAASIEKHGLLQPIVVRPLLNGRYEIIAGERRWRASRIAGLYRVPVIVKAMDGQAAAEAALIENLQREDLNAYEEALGYSALIEKFSLTQEEAAERVGKSRTAVTNALRLLKLPADILAALREGKITAGHARAMLSAEGEKQKEMLNAAIDGASVREIEAMLKKGTKSVKKEKKVDNYCKEVALALKDVLHRPVTVKGSADRGTLTIEFYSKAELAEFARRLAEKEE
ncbi:MAG: ParB/RepB/Spo0J family partition protein [Ruminococcaceae bacterium]|nr:ParB/RepB/Spo0J family partition protein [Oscillospiraceae bacterium]